MPRPSPASLVGQAQLRTAARVGSFLLPVQSPWVSLPVWEQVRGGGRGRELACCHHCCSCCAWQILAPCIACLEYSRSGSGASPSLLPRNWGQWWG